MKTSAARSELDAMTVGIELTLVSIIQGVALYFLIESSRQVLSRQQAIFWPYVLGGLLVILIFWSRSVLHIITVIRWPLEFGHNFLYIACALCEALLFTQLGDPRRWFLFGAGFSAIGWTLFVYDLRLIRARGEEKAGETSERMCALVTRDQWINIAVLLPGVFLLNVFCAVAVRARPGFFLVRHGHVWLAALQLAGFAGYLLYVLGFYKRVTPLIADARAEWRTRIETDANIVESE